jgi:predicted RNA-binding Zn-ribbon protein involved in translation (DUF1610 family)
MTAETPAEPAPAEASTASADAKAGDTKLATPPKGFTILATPEGKKDGLVTCPKCGASEAAFNQAKGLLFCTFCRNQWAPDTLDAVMGLSEGIGTLTGTIVTTAAVDITSHETLVTFKCTGCGAEVVIDTEHNLQGRCHWCKHTLSLNNKIDNGAVPDGILPFAVSKEQAMASISAFAGERKTFQHPDFKASFRPENIMGVYMPYMTVDGNVTVKLAGAGEILRKTVRVNDKRTEYHADQFTVKREIDAEIDDLIVETSAEKIDLNSSESTNNIINAILPFDVKNIVRFDAGFLGSEYSSEKRDLNVEHVQGYAANHFLTIARGIVAQSVSGYNRGVRWEEEEVNVKGSRWTSVMLPVWLYGFVETRKGKQTTHYIAVNGRSGAVMGSIPINRGKAAAVAWGVAGAISLITWPLALLILVASA